MWRRYMIDQKLIEKVYSLTYIGRGFHAYDVPIELKDKAIDVINCLLKDGIPPPSDIKAHGDGDIWLNWITEGDEYTLFHWLKLPKSL